MGLFSRKKAKEEENSCCCGGAYNTEGLEPEKKFIDAEQTVKVLGSGCAKCNELEANVRKALEQLKMDTNITHVTDFKEIAGYGVMSTPALVVDEKVVSYGKVLKVEEAVKLLQKISR
jgi:small redox-active disulfide protein 2